jgi:NADP-dependent 3-hydroxy acid dehydrogenase YdfG
MSKNPKTVLITGASSGIGEAAALRLADDGHRLFLGARRTQRLQALAGRIEAAGGTASFRRLDVTDAADVQQFVADATDTYGGVDVIINNAGVMPLSALAENKVDEWNRMIDVNIRGVLHGVSAALPVMRAQGSGHIINLASIGAHEVEPTAAVYCATKFAVWAISQGLRKEQSGDIRVSVISPGVTESELAESISDVQARDAMREYRALALPASAIADAIAFAIGQPPRDRRQRDHHPPGRQLPINSWFVGFAGRQSSDRLSAPARNAWWVTDRSLTMTVVSPNRPSPPLAKT